MKFPLLRVSDYIIIVILHVRMWIEIAKSDGAASGVQVILHVRMWIEIFRRSFGMSSSWVTLRVRV